MNSQPEVTRTLLPSPFRCITLALACAGMAGICFHLWFGGTDNAWIAGSFLAAASLFFIVHLVPGAYALWLDAQGFNVCEMFTIKRYAWSEVSEFSVRRGMLGHYVDFHYALPELNERRKVVLNETYGFKPLEMAQLLNDHRKQAAENQISEPRKVWRSQNC